MKKNAVTSALLTVTLAVALSNAHVQPRAQNSVVTAETNTAYPSTSQKQPQEVSPGNPIEPHALPPDDKDVHKDVIRAIVEVLYWLLHDVLQLW